MNPLNAKPKAAAKNIRGLLFDKDGTLIDFEKTWFAIAHEQALMAAKGDENKAHYLLELGGYDFENKRFKGDSPMASGSLLDLVKLWHPELESDALDNMVLEYRNHGAANSIFYVSEIDGISQSLKILKEQGYILGIATNDSELSARNCVEKLGWQDYFSQIIGWDSVKNAKPFADQIELFAQNTALSVDEIAMIGDNNHDISAARNANAGLAIGVLSGTGSKEQLEGKCDMLFPSVVELTNWLNSPSQHQN